MTLLFQDKVFFLLFDGRECILCTNTVRSIFLNFLAINQNSVSLWIITVLSFVTYSHFSQLQICTWETYFMAENHLSKDETFQNCVRHVVLLHKIQKQGSTQIYFGGQKTLVAVLKGSTDNLDVTDRRRQLLETVCAKALVRRGQNSYQLSYCYGCQPLKSQEGKLLFCTKANGFSSRLAD